MTPENTLAIDTEWGSNKEFLCSTCYGLGGGWLSSVFDNTLADWLRDPEKVVVFHNAKADLRVLEAQGYVVKAKVHDTYLMAKCLYEHFPSYSLDYLMYHILGDLHWPYVELVNWFRDNKMGSKGNKWKMEKVPREVRDPYAVKDAEGTFLLFWALLEGIKKKKLWKCYNIELKTIRPVMAMEHNGILIDRPWVVQFAQDEAARINKLVKKGKTLSGNKEFNFNSVRDMAASLLEAGIDLPRTEKGNLKFDKKTRSNIKHPLIKYKNAIAEAQKNLTTYCKNLLAASNNPTSTAYPNFQQSFAATRRFSSRGTDEAKLNWQNQPEEIRRAVIIPPKRVGWFFDYKGIENVLHIFFSGDKTRRKAYEQDESWSEYLWLAERILGEKITKEDPRYKRIKSTKLGMNYGLGWKKYARMNDLDPAEARSSFKEVSDACPAIKHLQNLVAAQLSRTGYVQDPFGYIYHGEPRMAYKVVAYMIQGCAAALMKCAMIRLHSLGGIRCHLTVHDEIFFSTKDDDSQWALAKIAKAEMEDFSFLFDDIPIRVETCRSTTSWAEKKRVDV